MTPFSPFRTSRIGWRALVFAGVCLPMLPAAAAWAMPANIARGQTLPDAELVGANRAAVTLHALKGRVTLISVVPQLNTPVCDEQTHRFSETGAEMGQGLEIVTISTNSHDDQVRFAEKSGIDNVTFLSDAPRFDFGTHTGLLHPARRILQRAVMVVDADHVVRYLEIVPMGQLPDIGKAMDAARTLLSLTSSAIPARSAPPQRGTPRGHPSDPAAPRPGIIGVALHLTAERVGAPAVVLIRAAHPTGPAVKAGLAHGQEILAVDGQSLQGKTYRDVVAMIRGDVGTPVTLLVKQAAGVREVEVVRVSEDSLLNTNDTGPTHHRRRLHS